MLSDLWRLFVLLEEHVSWLHFWLIILFQRLRLKSLQLCLFFDCRLLFFYLWRHFFRLWLLFCWLLDLLQLLYLFLLLVFLNEIFFLLLKDVFDDGSCLSDCHSKV